MSAVTTADQAEPVATVAGTVDTTLTAADRSRRAADRRAFLDGVRAMLPLLLGVAPFGLVIGVTVAELGVPHLAGWSLGWLVYAGSAQLAAVGLLASSASAAVVVASVVVINLRLGLYSAAMAPHWRGTSKAWRLVATYLLIDPSFAVGAQSYDGSRAKRQAHLHYLGGALVLWVGWLTVIGVGVTAGAAMPPELRLDSIGPLYIVALVVMSVRTAAAKVAVAVAVVTAVLASLLPLHLGPAVGMLAGLLAGSMMLKRSS
jgi:predicted branched-subunit amino acid permease